VVLTGYSLASSTTKTGCHDIAEILLKVALNTKNQSIIIIKLFVFLLNQSVPRQGKKKSLFAQQYSSTGVKDFGLIVQQETSRVSGSGEPEEMDTSEESKIGM
jgi:hypothetical protein